MKKCPFCGKEITELRGLCPHCQKELNGEAMRVMLQEISDAQTKQRAVIEEFATRMEKLEASGRERLDKATKDKVKPVSVTKILYAQTIRDWSGAAYEREIIEKYGEELRALGFGAIGSGGAIVPPEYLPAEFVDMLRSRLVCQKAGARILDNLTGSPVMIPRLASGATAFWVAENAAKTPSDQTLEQLNLTPHEVAAMTKVSNALLKLSNPSVESMINNDLAMVLARAVDLAALAGTGAGNQPFGILNTPAVGSYNLENDAGNGAPPTANDVDEIVDVLEQANADEGSISWVSNSRFFKTIKSMRDGTGGAGTGQFLFRDEINAGKLNMYPFYKTTQVPVNMTKGVNVDCSYNIFANWADLIIASWGGVELKASDVAGDSFAYNQTWVRASMLCEIAIRHLGSFVVTLGVRK